MPTQQIAWQHRTKNMLGLLQRCHLHQNLVRRMRGKVSRQILRGYCRINVPILKLDWHIVFVMHNDRTIEFAGLAQFETVRQILIRLDLKEVDNLGAICVASFTNFIGNIANFHGMAMDPPIGDKGANASNALQITGIRQFA